MNTNAAFAPVPHRLGLYPVVDSLAWLVRMLDAGVTTVQLRIKDSSEAQVTADIEAAVLLGRRYDARVFINDYWRLAIHHGAYGVHLGQEDMDSADAIRAAGLRLGLSTHDRAELARALGWLLYCPRPYFPHRHQSHAVPAAGVRDAATSGCRSAADPNGCHRRHRSRTGGSGAGLWRGQRRGGQRYHPGARLASGDQGPATTNSGMGA